LIDGDLFFTVLVPQGENPVLQLLGFLSLVTSKFSLCDHLELVRTNNDVEGWHHWIKRKAQKPNFQMYILFVLLHKDARLLPIQLKMVTEGKL
jgi:hypothetical protein